MPNAFSFISPKVSSPKKSILRWFLVSFLCFSLIFLIALLPLLSYCRKVFTDLEIRKSTQQMDFGISQLENTVTGVVSASQSLSSDIRFLPFLYQEPDYSKISVSVQKQMHEYLKGLTFPLTLVTDCTLLFDEYAAITPSISVLGNDPAFYPHLFCVDDMTYEEWFETLKEVGSGFLPVHHVTTSDKAYDALIYSMPWSKTSFLYVCLDISNIRKALIAKSDLESYGLTIENTDGECLYTDVSVSGSYRSVSQKTSLGGLIITVHIPHSSLDSRMEPLYYFLVLYLGLCISVLIIAVFIGSHLSSKPMLKIIDLIEKDMLSDSHNTFNNGNSNQKTTFQYGFQYIQNKVLSYENSLLEYRSTIDTQQKILQARFLEKGLHGSLATERDYEQFFSYFPEFPESFCLIQFSLMEQPENEGTIYSDAIALIQFYLESNLPDTYLQRLNNFELLIILDEETSSKTIPIINHLIDNINLEEPSYHAWAISSRYYSHPRNLPAAYWQLTDLSGRIQPESLTSLCNVSDCQSFAQPIFQMADALSIHSAISYGNKEAALVKLQNYADSLSTNDRSVFEMIRAILLCIKREHAVLLMDVYVPSYHAHMDMYQELIITVSSFCDALRMMRETAEIDPFTQKVKDYIDTHFAEDDLCLTKLGEHFHCSSSKIQRAFSRDLNITVSAYIEKLRMDLANKLLISGEDTVAEVAKKCGFTNDNTFHKAYRRVFGHSPKSIKQS